jgi:DNA-directed RNA polymerase subunit RPC12/RpoP
VFGHHVKTVTARDGFSEYACPCGHTFLKKRTDLKKITHPWICILAGHFVRFVGTRCGHSEYVCNNCGHPFLFATNGEGGPCRF